MALPAARATSVGFTAASGEVIVGERAGPHEVGARVIALGVLHDAARLGDDGADEATVKLVGHGNGAAG